jgi:hypothetical protein
LSIVLADRGVVAHALDREFGELPLEAPPSRAGLGRYASIRSTVLLVRWWGRRYGRPRYGFEAALLVAAEMDGIHLRIAGCVDDGLLDHHETDLLTCCRNGQRPGSCEVMNLAS